MMPLAEAELHEPDVATVLGFTGSRGVPTELQLAWMHELLRSENIAEFHHGACVGSDVAAHRAALALNYPIFVHPSSSPSHRARGLVALECLKQTAGVTVLPAKPPLDRNRDIVEASFWIIALPSRPESAGGGTWYTVHYAQKMGRTVVICDPDGIIETRWGKAA
jgi:hypothetical protein